MKMKYQDARGEDVGSSLFWRFARDESGVTAIEYSLIGTLVAVAIVAGATIVGLRLDTMYMAVSGNF